MVNRKNGKSKSAILLYGNSEGSADMLYFTRMFVPDAFVALKVGKKKIAVLSSLEYSRALKESTLDEVLLLEEWRKKVSRVFRKKNVGVVEIIRLLAREYQVGKFEVSRDFPVGLAFDLRKARVKLEVVEEGLFPEREVKDAAEAEAIRKGNVASACGIRAAEKVLRDSVPKNGKLYLRGKILTSEQLRMYVDIACLEAGAVANRTIVAGGNQACDPHCIGSGPLRSNELIIVDVFPRVTATGYHGDMTRTFLRGRASEKQKKLVATVLKGQKLGVGVVRAGVSGCRVHQEVVDFFEKEGYLTRKEEGGYQGFFHGTGHGLGLEVHEDPGVSPYNKKLLKAGAVITVEPGLYYPGLGGCRIEDVVWVQERGCKMLSKYHYRWQL